LHYAFRVGRRVKKGEHTFRVRATDLSGNTGPADSFSFKRTKK